MPPLENHKLWGFPLENPKPSSYFCRCFFWCFAGLWFSSRCVAVFLRNIHFLVKNAPSRKSQTSRISFRESQTVFHWRIKRSTHSFSRVSRRSKTHPVFAGTSSPGWPLENGNMFFMNSCIYIYLYISFICFYKGIFLAAKVDKGIF